MSHPSASPTPPEDPTLRPPQSEAPLGHEDHATPAPARRPLSPKLPPKGGLYTPLAALLAALTFLLGALFGGGITHLVDESHEGHQRPYGHFYPQERPEEGLRRQAPQGSRWRGEEIPPLNQGKGQQQNPSAPEAQRQEQAPAPRGN